MDIHGTSRRILYRHWLVFPDAGANPQSSNQRRTVIRFQFTDGNGHVEAALQISCWLAAWTSYQLPRHYFVAIKQYRHALALDGCVIVLSMFCFIANDASKLSYLLSSAMLLCSVVCIAALQRTARAQPLRFHYDRRGLLFGLSNLMSGGVALMLIPIASLMEGESFAGLFSLFMSICAAGQLLPRAISLDQLPTIARVIHKKEKLNPLIKQMKKLIFLGSFATLAVCATAALFILLTTAAMINPVYLATTFGLMMAYIFLGNQTLVAANILMANEKAKEILKINSVVFVIFLCTTGALLTTQVAQPFLYLVAMLLVLSIYTKITTDKVSKLLL